MVSTFLACVWAGVGILLGAAWGVVAMALIHAARDHKEDKEDDNHDDS